MCELRRLVNGVRTHFYSRLTHSSLTLPQFDGLALLSVNDEKIVNIYGLAAALRKATGPFLRFEFT